jgi:hypothetical protein
VKIGLHTSTQSLKHLSQTVSHCESRGVCERRKEELTWLGRGGCVARPELHVISLNIQSMQPNTSTYACNMHALRRTILFIRQPIVHLLLPLLYR